MTMTSTLQVDLPLDASPIAIANTLVLSYLRDRGMDLAHAAFLQQLEDSAQPHPLYLGSLPLPPLVALIEHCIAASLSQSLASVSLNHHPGLSDLEVDASINHPPTDPALQLLSPLPNEPHTSFPLIHASNILTSQALVIPTLNVTPLLVTSAADKSIQFTDPASSLTVASVSLLPAPALAIAQHPLDPNVLAAGCMDGSVLVLHASSNDDQRVSITHTLPTHTPKPCVTLTWTRDGRKLVSGGYNAQLTVSTYDPERHLLSTTPDVQYHLPNAIESIVLAPPGSASPYALVAVRDASVLYLCSLTQATQPVEISTHDANSFPGHVSFSILHLSASPSGKYVLAATSAASGRLQLYRWTPAPAADADAGSDAMPALHLVRNYYTGGAHDTYAKPRTAWLASDAYFAVTSDDTHAILVLATYPRAAAGKADYVVRAPRREHVYTTTAEQVVARLHAHTHVVRDLTYSTEAQVLVSGGFDHVVRMWKVVGGQADA